MPQGVRIRIKTPHYEKYKDDCLHPCIRYIEEGFLGHQWWMVQSPYYGTNNKIENPILYFSRDKEFPTNWEAIGVVSDTPEKGYNSDPNLYFENGKLWIFWRECNTPLCEKLNVSKATVGVSTTDALIYSEKQVYLTEKRTDVDHEQCPILIRKQQKYLFYAAYYQYKPKRKSLGIAIWEGTSLENPDFRLNSTLKAPTTYTCDQYKQLRIRGRRIFIPKPLKHDIWHFDLIEYKGEIYILSVAEWGDNIMLSVLNESLNIKTLHFPLINKHYSQQYSLYKPTGFIHKDKLYVYYTAKSKSDRNANELYASFCDFSKVYT